MLIKFKLDPGAVLPSQEIGDVGFDIRANEDVVIHAGRVAKVKTGLYIADYDYLLRVEHHSSRDQPTQLGFNMTVYPKIEGRSSLGSKGIFTIAGIIDPIYRGEICVTLANMSGDDYRVQLGDKIAQFVFYPCIAIPEMMFTVVDEVTTTRRGAKGFGSTGR